MAQRKPKKVDRRRTADDVLKAARDLVHEALAAGYKPPDRPLDGHEPGALRIAAARARCDRNTFQGRIRAAALRGFKIDWRRYKPIENEWTTQQKASSGALGFAPVLPGFAIKRTSQKVGEAWVQQTRAPGEVFEIPDGHAVKGVSALVDADGREIAKWVKTREGDRTTETIAAIRSAFEDIGAAAPVAAPEAAPPELLSVYPIADHHLGLFSWGRETGADYDLKIAETLLLDAMRSLVALSQPSETAVVLNLGDFLHADDSSNRTARSEHALDVDTRYAKVLQVAVRLLVACVDMALTRHERVILRNLPGNHDPHSALALTAALGAYYRNEPRVTVDDDPGKFFFHRHGRVMIAATHGDMADMARLPEIAATLRAQMWGQTLYRHGFTGHIHHRSRRISEGGGMIVESFQTLAAKDAWHAGEGYTALRSLCALTYHRERGEIKRETATVNLRGRIDG